MKRKEIVMFAILVSLGGCAQIDAARTWLGDPQTQAAANTLRSGAVAFACQIASTAALASKIEVAIKAQQAAIDTTGNVYTVSSMVCASFGGTVTGQVVMQ